MANRTVYTSKTMTRSLAQQLVDQYGGKIYAARAIYKQSVDDAGNVPTPNAVSFWIGRALNGQSMADRPKMYEGADAEQLNRLKELIDKANIPIESIGAIKMAQVKAWGVHAKIKQRDAKGKVIGEEIVKDGLYSTSLTLSPTWDEGPKWPVIQPAAPVKVPMTPRTKRKREGKVIVVISDTQIGFLRNVRTDELEPIHDPQAIDVALQVVADVQPDQIGYVGDFVDLPEHSRWLQQPEFIRTTQPGIDAAGRILEQFEAAAGPLDVRLPTQFVSGNHDRRLREYAVKNAMASFGLRPANEPPEGWNEEASIERLLHFKKLGIEYVGEYPHAEWWITDRLVVRHNPEGKEAYDASVIAGHSHHIRRETFTRRTRTGPRAHTLYEIGCLCQLGNYSDKRSLMGTRVPSNRGFAKNWAQGFAIVHLDNNGSYLVEQVEIMQTKRGPKAIRPDGRVYAA